MNSSEIEYLITEAINNRPRVTVAPMNLYIYDGKLICGARTSMPRDATFVTHVPPYQLQNGFGEREWKLIVEKIKAIAETEALGGIKLAITKRDGSGRQTDGNQARFNERRREQRFRYRRPIWFAENFSKTLSEGQMVDISSGGVGFTCRADENYIHPGRQIATRFSAPRFNPDKSFDTISFNRIGRICRVDKPNSTLRRVAVQFAKPLPFKPAEQYLSKPDKQQNLKAATI